MDGLPIMDVAQIAWHIITLAVY